jgi:hypothetical protein
MTTYSYSAILVQQTDSSKPMLLLSAPAAEIQKWAGIPQKKKFAGTEDKKSEEAIGFQREENGKRINEIGQFFGDDQNVIQNPLLCATRVDDKSILEFIISQDNGDGTQIGKLTITVPDYSKVPFKELLGEVRSYLEKRVPKLEKKKPSESLITALKKNASKIGYFAAELEIEDTESAEDTENEDAEEVQESLADSADSVTASLFEESHIADFWDEIAARHEVAKLIADDLDGDSFLGFTRESLAAYVYPVVLVDGQHRLKGAIRAAQIKVKSTELQSEIENRILEGESPDEIEEQLLVRESRRLPISLLISADPAEQVFQFVIVNQKATPIGRALLGTIVSTTLSVEEMQQVANRLKNAGIELEESQAVTYLAKHPNSPFFGKIESGVGTGDSQDRLQWNVFSSLVSIFRNLKGGKLYHDKLDYAQMWKNNYLASSAIVADFSEKGHSTPEEYWSQINGPWRDVFVAFWSEIKDYFGSENLDAPLYNYWGKPRESNLFNKPSLTILSADFFQYLTDKGLPIDSISEIKTLVSNWLIGVKPGYFARDWNLGGVKKDSDPIRRAWAIAWKDYRKDIGAQLPNAKSVYRSPKPVQF